MKQTSILLFAAAFLVTACNEKKTDTTTPAPVETPAATPPETATGAHAGVYTENGKTYSGKVETSTADMMKTFSVVCKGDMINEISFVFKNEAAARKGGPYKTGSMAPADDNEVGIIYGIGYQSMGAPEGTITVTGGGTNTIEFNDLVLSAGGKNVTVSGRIPF